MEWAREASVRWKPRPYVWCAWERERGDSLPHRQKKRIAHRVSVDSRRSVRSTQNPLAVRKVGRRVVLHCSNNIRKIVSLVAVTALDSMIT